MIKWRVHLASPPDVVHAFVATDEGRARFWAESTEDCGGKIEFRFPDGSRLQGRVLANDPPRFFALEYFGTRVEFELARDGEGGTEVTLVDESDHPDTRAGWVSVLLALKGAADHGVDLRNHDSRRTWEQGFVDN